jgi:hypothetical protein
MPCILLEYPVKSIGDWQGHPGGGVRIGAIKPVCGKPVRVDKNALNDAVQGADVRRSVTMAAA